MTKIQNIIIIVFILLITRVTAQTDFKPGFYISTNHDTVHGLLDYRGDVRNSRLCVFKRNDDSPRIEFGPDKILGYRFKDSKFYVSKEVKTSDGVKVIFAEFLVNGIADLFYYRDENGDHYLIETKDGKLNEIKKEDKNFYMKRRGEVLVKDYRYIGILKATFADCPEVQSEVEKVEIDHESLIKLTKTYHDYVCEGEKCIIYEKKMPVAIIGFAPYLGFGFAKFGFDDKLLDFELAKSITISAYLSISLPRFNERLSIQFGYHFSILNFNSIYETDNYYSALPFYTEYLSIDNQELPNYYGDLTKINIQNKSILKQTSMGLKYNFPSGKSRPEFAVGVVSASFYKSDSEIDIEITQGSEMERYDYTDIVFPSAFVGGYIMLGNDISLTKKISLSLNLKYTHLRSHYMDELSGKASLKMLEFNLGIKF